MSDAASGPTVLVLGEGRLRDALLNGVVGSTSRDLEPDLVISSADTWADDLLAPDHARAVALGVPWMAVRARVGHVVIGPWQEPGVPGCIACASEREMRANAHQAEHERLVATQAGRLATVPSPWLTHEAASIAAKIVADDIESWSTGGVVRTRGAVMRISLDVLNARRHTLLPNPLCEECGNLPGDHAEAARWPRLPLPKPSADTYRLRDLRTEREHLLEFYVDDAYGLVRRVGRQSAPALALSDAPMGLRHGPDVETGYGRGLDYAGTDLTAVLEALERHGGIEPGGRAARVRATYAEVAADAVDPTTLGLHSPEQYDAPGFPYQPFDPDRVMHWMWGYSLTEQRPVLVPKSIAYSLPKAERRSEAFVYEISNGCALGSSLPEAALHGLLEVVERDAFLVTWHARMALPEVDVRSSPDPAVGTLALRLGHTSGYTIRLFDATMEHGVPAVWAIAVNEHDDERAVTVSAAGAHPRPAAAALAALCELATMVDSVNLRFPSQRARSERMAENPDLVQVMADHALLHAHPAARDRLDFLLAPGRVRSFEDAFCPPEQVIGGADLAADLDTVVARFAEHGLPVLVVDQTTDEHRAHDLHCVKTIVPGMLPMTFGHRFRRLTSLPRLVSTPAALTLGSGTVATDPHPFP